MIKVCFYLVSLVVNLKDQICSVHKSVIQVFDSVVLKGDAVHREFMLFINGKDLHSYFKLVKVFCFIYYSHSYFQTGILLLVPSYSLQVICTHIFFKMQNSSRLVPFIGWLLM